MINKPNFRSTLRPKGKLQWTLTIVAFILCLISPFLLYYTVYPHSAYHVFSILAMVFSIDPRIMLITVAIIILFGVFAFWKKTFLAAIAYMITLCLFSSAMFYQFYGVYSMAKDENISLSIIQNFGRSSTYTDLPNHSMNDIVYATLKDGTKLLLNVWPAQNANAGKPDPAIVRIHGGGWIEGGRGESPHWNQWLNENGYTVFDVEYRMPPPERWKVEVGDVKAAIGWVAENASTYNIDPERISLMGQSAGGNLAMLAAYSMNSGSLPPSVGDTVVPIKSVINFYGPSDLTRLFDYSLSLDYVHNILSQYIGGSPSDFPERYQAVSPIQYVNSTTPPTITFLGLNDHIISAEQAEVLDQAMTSAGAYHEMYLLPGADHAFDTYLGNIATQYARAKLEAFLKEHS
ncbi:lipase [Paenibacillus alvei TS-15]|uniref:Lipase n=2 Tax=Paenibacillus alvei TaxID=44250 RepID=S9SSE7_PAEAL|nr:lipase [Paenibacillus alvei TS-15]